MLSGVSGEALHEARRNLKRGYPFIAMLPVLGAGSAVTFVDAPASREGADPRCGANLSAGFIPGDGITGKGCGLTFTYPRGIRLGCYCLVAPDI
jgi:hypothetical protein